MRYETSYRLVGVRWMYFAYVIEVLKGVFLGYEEGEFGAGEVICFTKIMGCFLHFTLNANCDLRKNQLFQV